MVTKAPAKEKDTEFNILVADVDKARVDEAAEAFSAAFGLEAAVAQQIVKSSPIVFLTNATKAELKAITPRLIEISKAGIEFRVTTQSVQKIPKVNWPVRPQFAFGSGPSDEGRSATYNFERNVFVCPCCGETFLFRRVGRPPLGAGKAETPDASPAPATPEAPKAAAPAAKAAPRPASAIPPALDETSIPEAAVAPEEEALEPAEPADNLLAEEAPAEEPLLPSEENLSPEDQPALAPTPVPEPAPEEPAPIMDEQPLLEEPLEEEAPPPPPPPPPPKPAPAAPKPAPAPAPKTSPPAAAPKPAPAAAPKPAPKPAAPPPPPPEAEEAPVEPEAAAAPSGGTGDTFNVFLSKITSNDKKEQAAKLISEVKACPIEEARELAGRLIIPLLKDVAKADAESALNKFKSIKVTGRMTISRKK